MNFLRELVCIEPLIQDYALEVQRWRLRRPHFVAIKPYDPEKHVWILDDHVHAIYKFSNDGEELVQTTERLNQRGEASNVDCI